MKLTSEELALLRAIDDDAHGDLKLHIEDPRVKRLRAKGMVFLYEDGDYETHIGLKSAGRAALRDPSNG